MRTLLQELRYSIHMLAKKPGFAVIAIIILAAGIGLNSHLQRRQLNLVASASVP